jgi:hypothetical protein
MKDMEQINSPQGGLFIDVLLLMTISGFGQADSVLISESIFMHDIKQ